MPREGDERDRRGPGALNSTTQRITLALACICVVVGVATLGACIGAGEAARGGPRATITAGSPGPTIVVYAAASLGDGFRKLASAYEREHAGTRVNLSLDASN